MKKNNVAVSQRGLKRDAKNKARLKRAKALREFNKATAYVKMVQSISEQMQAQSEKPKVEVYTGAVKEEAN
jgi:hypothetical protein